MRYRNIAREQLQTQLAYAGKLPYCPIRHVSDTTESQQNGGVYIAKEGAQARVMVHVFDDDDPRGGNLKNAVPPIATIVKAAPGNRRLAGTEPSRCRVPDHG